MEANFSKRELLPPTELRELSRKSDSRGWSQLLSHLLAIGVVALFHAQAMGSYWVVLTGLILGVLLNFLYAAQHELSHSTVFATKKLNEFWGRAIGFFMLFPRDFDQVMHFAHHRHTQDWERDGELVREPYTLRSYLLWLGGLSYWRNRVIGLVRRARGIIVEPYIRKKEEHKIIRESQIHLALYFSILIVSVLSGSWAWATFWILPMLLTKPVHQLQNTIEHLGLSHEDNTLENTRSTRTNSLGRWLCWQMPYHTAHHTFPTVPFWQLKKLNEKIETHIGKPVWRMGWIEFQIEVIKKLRAKDESQYPMNEIWVVPVNGSNLRLEAN